MVLCGEHIYIILLVMKNFNKLFFGLLGLAGLNKFRRCIVYDF
jgi:hypothetical protein